MLPHNFIRKGAKRNLSIITADHAGQSARTYQV